MIKKYDVFVIGSGTAGKKVADTCAEAGMTVAIADNREYGGTCSNRGCDPKKVVMAATEAWEMATHLHKKGMISIPKINWKNIQRFKRSFTDSIPVRTEKHLKKRGIDLYHQSPKFIDTHTLMVEGKTITADKIVIATGYEPATIPIKGRKYLKVSDDFLNLKKLPKSMVFIGAGYVGMEFAHIAVRAGVKVTVIETGTRPLDIYDEDLVQQLTEYSKKIGINFIFKARATEIKKTDKHFIVKYKIGKKEKKILTKMVFNTTGRVPAIGQLDIEKAGIKKSENGIVVNDFLQSKSIPNIYACGDVSDHSVPLTPLSAIEGIIVAKNIIHGNKEKIEIPLVPSVVFTQPQLARVGQRETEARKRYKKVIVKTDSVPEWFNAKRLNAPVYAYKIIINERTEKILGATILGPEANEMINLFTLAINQKMTASEIKRTIFTYPSWGNNIKKMV